MATLVFDIETAGEDFEALDKPSKEAMTRWIEQTSTTDTEYKQRLDTLKDQLGFSPYTAEIVAISVLDLERGKGKVYFQAPGKEIEPFEEKGYKYEPMSEPEMLKKFWLGAENYDTFVTFNGRGFDIPFLMVRSAIHKVKTSVNLMGNRYIERQKYGLTHVDLQDQFAFYGAFYKKGGLHMITRAFGIESPKGGDIKGAEVGKAFAAGKYKQIARYNVRDVEATAKLYEYWNEYMRF